MADHTKIPWANATVNPWRGGTKVSEGCLHCYAIEVCRRLAACFPDEDRFRGLVAAGQWTGVVKLDETQLLKPLHWRDSRAIFWCSLSDFFHPAVPDDWRDRAFAVMALTPQHQHIVLTKRPPQMQEYTGRREARGWGWVQNAMWRIDSKGRRPENREEIAEWFMGHSLDIPLPNVHLGVSAENQARWDERVAVLADLAAAGWKTFVSLEPLLGPVDVGLSIATCDCCERWPSRWVRLRRPIGPDMPGILGQHAVDHVADAGLYRAHSNSHGALSVMTPKGLLGIKPGEFECLPAPGGVIVGGESGPARGVHAPRPMHPDWVRSIRDQCGAAGVPFFFKQWGTSRMYRDERGEQMSSGAGEHKGGRVLDGRTHDDLPWGIS